MAALPSVHHAALASIAAEFYATRGHLPSVNPSSTGDVATWILGVIVFYAALPLLVAPVWFPPAAAVSLVFGCATIDARSSSTRWPSPRVARGLSGTSPQILGTSTTGCSTEPESQYDHHDHRL